MSIKSGFFNAHKDEDTNEFDRTYTEEDMTNYLRGTLIQNGVFSKVGNRMDVVPVTGQREVNVLDGKALVNGHWCIIEGTENIQIPTADIAKYRRDTLVLEWSSEDRSVSLKLIDGSTNGNLIDPTGGNLVWGDVPPVGFIGSSTTKDWKGQDEFAPVEIVEGEGYIVQIFLAYIIVPPNVSDIDPVVNDPAWKPTSRTILIDTTVKGTRYCPWITQMALDPEIAYGDLDAYLALFKSKILDFWNTMSQELQVNLNISYFNKHVNGGKNVSAIIPMNMYGYIYSPGDIIFVYYNGLNLCQDQEYILVDVTSETKGIKILNLQNDKIPSGNHVDIMVMKGSPIDIPIGNELIY